MTEKATRESKLHIRSVLDFSSQFSDIPPSRNAAADQRRIKFFFQHPSAKAELESWTPLHADHSTPGAAGQSPYKIQKLAMEYRAIGVSLFVKADDVGKITRLRKSLDAFNMALAHSSFLSETDRIETSKIFANRSAVFFDLKRYIEASKDIETALNMSYPFPHKVWIRRAKILLEEGKHIEALDVVDFIEQSKMLEATEMWKLVSIKKLATNGIRIKKNSNEAADSGSNSKHGSEKQLKRTLAGTRATFEENRNLQYGSRRLDVKYDNQRTRHILAKENLEPGDVLFDEIPYASVLLPQLQEDYCHHCHTFLTGYIFPCSIDCCEVRYCSEDCSKLSYQYHKTECCHASVLASVGICHLAIRTILTAGIDTVLDTVKLDPSLEDAIRYFSIPNDAKEVKAQEYRRIYSLVQHSHAMNPVDMFTYSRTAARLTLWLQQRTDFFKNRTEDDIFGVGGAILHHTCQLICNAQRLYAFCREDGAILDYERTVIGSGIYASTSLMNHSCDPNISTNYKFGPGEGHRLIVKATRQIKAEEEVLNSYGLTYQRHDVMTRQSSLSQQYCFICACSHCQEEKKTGKSFVEFFESMLCIRPSCRGSVYFSSTETTAICSKCGSATNLTDYKSVFKQKEHQDLRAAKVGTQEYHQMLLRNLGSFQKTLSLKHRFIAETNDKIAQSFLCMGIPDAALPYLKRSLDYVRDRFGPRSNEYGIELRKYAELLEMLGLAEDASHRKTIDLMNEAVICLDSYSPSTD